MIVANRAHLHLGRKPEDNFLAFNQADNKLCIMLEEVNRLYALVTCAAVEMDLVNDLSTNPQVLEVFWTA